MNEDKYQSHAAVGHFTIDADVPGGEPVLDALPLIATRDFVLFPEVTFPIAMGRPQTLMAARFAHEHGMPVGVVCQRDPNIEMPLVPGDVGRFGVFADILQIIELPDGQQTAIVRARGKFKIMGAGLPDAAQAHGIPGDVLTAQVSPMKESRPRVADKEFAMLLTAVKETMISIFKKAGNVPEDIKFNIENATKPEIVINLVATHAPFTTEFKLQLLAQSRLKERAFMLLTELSKNDQLMEIGRDIQRRTRQRIDESQRTAFLQHQMEAIREELYGDEDEAQRLREKGEKVAFTDEARRTFAKEVDRLEHLAPQSPDYSTQYTYLQTLIELPWQVYDSTNTDFEEAEKILNADHYGLEKVKDRILEQIAVLINNPDGKAPILCLVGAPGVGKTSLGTSIAKAMGRRYQRAALGGLHDEAEIRGHRRTYIGAMPGRIIDAIKRAGSSNPVILLDEIDKIGADFKGDPAAALLEVLDPEQNCHFHDNYIDIDYDLSKVLFIATANSLSTIPSPLLDRMEIIDISGYMAEEKVEIARRHLIPRLLSEHKLLPEDIDIPDDTIMAVITGYTGESGVRQLEKQLAKIVRRVILDRQRSAQSIAPMVTVTPDLLNKYLGIQRYNPQRYEAGEYPGCATGLAWTSAGGEILFIESSTSPSKAFTLELTGNLGSVMKESATVATAWVKSHSANLGIDPAMFTDHTLHIHAPEGAIPKDGPSAGITIVTSIVSAMTGVPVTPRLAMTGEMTLRGRVLPVGGIKEKLLAARRAGILTIVLPADNRRDVEDIPEQYLQGLTFHYVDHISQVLALSVPSAAQASTAAV